MATYEAMPRPDAQEVINMLRVMASSTSPTVTVRQAMSEAVMKIMQDGVSKGLSDVTSVNVVNALMNMVHTINKHDEA